MHRFDGCVGNAVVTKLIVVHCCSALGSACEQNPSYTMHLEPKIVFVIGMEASR